MSKEPLTNDRFIRVDSHGEAGVIHLPIDVYELNTFWTEPGLKGAVKLPLGTKRVFYDDKPYFVDFPKSRILDERANEWSQFEEPMTLQKAADFIVGLEVKR